MGGKRPDQYAIDPGEANATDYKERRHQEFIPEDKEKVEKSMHPQRKPESHIPEGGVNPALAELRARKERDEEQARGESHGEGGKSASGSDGASEQRQPMNASRDESRRAPDAERTE